MIGDIPMRRYENQVHDRKILTAILDNIMVVHVGMYDDEYPYVVPMSFGYETTEEKLLVYLHCAREGHKVELWSKNPKVSLTFSMFTNHPNDKYRGSMHDFRSVMANGLIRKIDPHSPGGQHGNAVQHILRHNGRRSNQFSVSHYRYMAIYVVECSWANVTAKSEEPMEHPGEVSFPDLETIRNSTKPPYDYNYFFSVKHYLPAFEEACPPTDSGSRTLLAGRMTLPVSRQNEKLEFHFYWDAPDDVDVDILACVLDEAGKIPRRYDLAFYNQASDRSSFLVHNGDDILHAKNTESITVDFAARPAYASEIVFLMSIYQASRQKQTLAMIQGLGLDVISSASGERKMSCCLNIADRDACAAALIRVKQVNGTWIMEPEERSYEEWQPPMLTAHYGLTHWKE